MQLDQAVAFLHNVDDLSCQKSLAEVNSGSDPALLSRLDQGLPDIVFFSLQQKNLDLRLGAFLHAVQSGGNYLCIVDDKAVARSQIVHNILKMAVFHLSGHLVKHHQSGA